MSGLVRNFFSGRQNLHNYPATCCTWLFSWIAPLGKRACPWRQLEDAIFEYWRCHRRPTSAVTASPQKLAVSPLNGSNA